MISVIKRDGTSVPLWIKAIVKQMEQQLGIIHAIQTIYKKKKDKYYLLKLFANLNEASHITFAQLHNVIFLFVLPLEIHNIPRISHPKRKQKNSTYEALLAPPKTH